MTVPTFLSVSGSPVTSSGTLAVSLSGVPLPVLNGGTGGANAADARNELGAACKSCNETLTGNKTFSGTVNMQTLARTFTSTTSSSYTVDNNTTWLTINTSVLTTLTLPNAASYPGKELHIRQTGGGSLQSASSNIIPFQTPPTGSTSTGILTASTHRAVTLVSDGTNWVIMQRSGV
jgi:hypothetical protein